MASSPPRLVVPFIDDLGIEFLDAPIGEGRVALQLEHRHLNSWHVAHGGVLMTHARHRDGRRRSLGRPRVARRRHRRDEDELPAAGPRRHAAWSRAAARSIARRRCRSAKARCATRRSPDREGDRHLQVDQARSTGRDRRARSGRGAARGWGAAATAVRFDRQRQSRRRPDDHHLSPHRARGASRRRGVAGALPARRTCRCRRRRRAGAGAQSLPVARPVHARPHERDEVVRDAAADRRDDDRRDRRRGRRVAATRSSRRATRSSACTAGPSTVAPTARA